MNIFTFRAVAVCGLGLSTEDDFGASSFKFVKARREGAGAPDCDSAGRDRVTGRGADSEAKVRAGLDLDLRRKCVVEAFVACCRA